MQCSDEQIQTGAFTMPVADALLAETTTRGMAQAWLSTRVVAGDGLLTQVTELKQHPGVLAHPTTTAGA